jgi:hypothetical protein
MSDNSEKKKDLLSDNKSLFSKASMLHCFTDLENSSVNSKQNKDKKDKKKTFLKKLFGF